MSRSSEIRRQFRPLGRHAVTSQCQTLEMRWPRPWAARHIVPSPCLPSNASSLAAVRQIFLIHLANSRHALRQRSRASSASASASPRSNRASIAFATSSHSVLSAAPDFAARTARRYVCADTLDALRRAATRSALTTGPTARPRKGGAASLAESRQTLGLGSQRPPYAPLQSDRRPKQGRLRRGRRYYALLRRPRRPPKRIPCNGPLAAPGRPPWAVMSARTAIRETQRLKPCLLRSMQDLKSKSSRFH
jgi:hypothetical protein